MEQNDRGQSMYESALEKQLVSGDRSWHQLSQASRDYWNGRYDKAHEPAAATALPLGAIQQPTELLRANEIMRKALETIAEPANAHCGCDFPCRCDTEAAEAINAGGMRDTASEALAAEAELAARFRAEGGNTQDNSSGNSGESVNSAAPAQAQVAVESAAPLGFITLDAAAALAAIPPERNTYTTVMVRNRAHKSCTVPIFAAHVARNQPNSTDTKPFGYMVCGPNPDDRDEFMYRQLWDNLSPQTRANYAVKTELFAGALPVARNTPPQADERAAFEAYIKQNTLRDTARASDGTYYAAPLDQAWHVWQAARALPAQAPAQPPEHEFEALQSPAVQAQTDRDEAITLLAAVFDAWENGDPCHEDGDPSSTYLGMAFRLDDDVFHRCCDLLNRVNPPRNAAPAVVQAQTDAIIENVTASLEEIIRCTKDTNVIYVAQTTLSEIEAALAAPASTIPAVQDAQPMPSPLYFKALALVHEAGRASVSMVQRRLAIKYSEAENFVQLMVMRGDVTPEMTSGKLPIAASTKQTEG